MHTVENNTVVDDASNKVNQEHNGKDASTSYTDALNSAINSTRRKSIKDISNRFFYTVGDNNFLFEKELKVENIPLTSINKVPHTPEWCKGIISIRGVIMPVVDMHSIINNDENQKATITTTSKNKLKNKPYLLMIEHKNHDPIILQIDKLPERVNIKDYTYSRSANNSPDWQGKTWKNSTNKLFEVDHDKLFNSIKN
jgi:chemotaxis signal transduction protein